jgi:cell division protein ZapD
VKASIEELSFNFLLFTNLRSIVILYEHPFNERIRTYLRLEYLLGRFEQLLLRSSEIDHHFALTTLFEIVDVGGRSDLKSDILKELDRHKHQFNSYRGNPSVSEEVLDELLMKIDKCQTGFNTMGSRIGNCVNDNDFLSSLRNRVGIPGGTCAFDLPAYHAWKQLDPDERRQNILKWSEPLKALNDSVVLLMRLLRESGAPQRVVATHGQFQQALPQGRFQLMRVFINPALGLVPEISGNRMMVWVRLINQNWDGKPQASNENAEFEIELCA